MDDMWQTPIQTFLFDNSNSDTSSTLHRQKCRAAHKGPCHAKVQSITSIRMPSSRYFQGPI